MQQLSLLFVAICCLAFGKAYFQHLLVADEKTVTLAFRLPEHLVDRIDTFMGKVNASMPGLAFSRAQAVRVLLEKGLVSEGIPPRRSAKSTVPKRRPR